jgi:hypothetical protein
MPPVVDCNMLIMKDYFKWMVSLGGKNVERFWFYRKLIFNYRMLDKNRDGSQFDDIVESIK